MNIFYPNARKISSTNRKTVYATNYDCFFGIRLHKLHRAVIPSKDAKILILFGIIMQKDADIIRFDEA